MAGETAQEGGPMARLLIILYAAGIITVGIQPLKRGYAHFFAELERSFQRVVRYVSSPPPLREKARGAGNREGSFLLSTPSNGKALDGITKEDRKRLQSLIDGL